MESLTSRLNAWKADQIMVNPGVEELKNLALSQHAKRTQYDSVAVVTKLKSRSANFTRTSVDGTLKDEDFDVIYRLKDYLKERKLIQLDLCMCPGGGALEMHCRLFVDASYAYLAYMAKQSLAPCTHPKAKPDLTVIDLPAWNNGDRRILVDHTEWTTFVLGSDYYGEIKKAFLRMTMYRGKLAGGLGLHAGSKRLLARSSVTQQVRPYGMLLFGLSGTGKTSLTCHSFDLNLPGEKNFILQDDVVVLTADGRAIGTEGGGFYIKTEALTASDQPILYKAAIQPGTAFENVACNDKGIVDFMDTKDSKNARAIVRIKDVDNTSDNFHLDKVDAFVFITRHHLIPPIARLTPEQGAVAFMLGESIKTSAADPSAKGEPVREVGTNPFIMGDYGEEGNRILELIRKHNIKCFLLNTGSVGRGDKKQKIKIEDSTSLLRALCRDAIAWKKDPLLHFDVPDTVFGEPLAPRLNMHSVWPQSELEQEYQVVRKERETWLAQFPKLNRSVLEALY
jgi:phosphoenolpyruvate carboxykinase (ATP)